MVNLNRIGNFLNETGNIQLADTTADKIFRSKEDSAFVPGIGDSSGYAGYISDDATAKKIKSVAFVSESEDKTDVEDRRIVYPLGKRANNGRREEPSSRRKTSSIIGGLNSIYNIKR